MVRLCDLSRQLYNRCNYLRRQAWFTNQPLQSLGELVKAVENEPFYRNLHNTKTAKQTIRKCLSDWSNFFKALKVYKKNPNGFKKRPKPPSYKDKLAQVIFYNETISKKHPGHIVPTNGLFDISSNHKFKQVTLTPKTFGFVVDVQYETEEQPKPENDKCSSAKKGEGYCCIDLGLDNLCAITSDQHVPILVNGRPLKSINQWFNKKPTSKKRSRKRYWRIENYFHHVSKFIVDLCVRYGNGTIVIGNNKGWKDGMNIGKRNNQNFQYIPFYRLVEKIHYKASLVGIEVIQTEEAYTSKASFVDRDPIPEYDQKALKPKMSGKRISRGCYRTKDGRILNADSNGSANIGRKVIRNEHALLGLDRGLAEGPVRIDPLKLSTYVGREWSIRQTEDMEELASSAA